MPKVYVITINTANAAFECDPRLELARLLADLATQIRQPWTDIDHIVLRDLNGDEVGEAVSKED